MVPAEELRLDRIVLEAAALEGADQDRYLRRLTATHPELLAEARRLLDAAARLTGSFLARSPAELLDATAPSAGDQDLDPPASAAGARYRLDRRLGAGGMAEVYLAHDRQLSRPVALKRLTSDDPGVLRRCLEEARAQARVRHDHVLEVYETGELDGRPFIAMHYVDGTTLLGIRDTTSLEQQVRLAADAAEGLDAAHRTGLIHRDIKPSNLLVETADDGSLKAWVADFGIAAELHQPGPSALEGTPAYLAPERLRGSAQPIDRRSDVFSFGVTLYQLFTGELPFQGSLLLELLHQIRSVEPRRPRQLAPHLPAELEAIVLRCLAKEPDRRYPTAGAVAADLRRFLAGELVEAHTAGLAYRATRFALRHRLLLAVVAVAVMLLAAALSIASARGLQALRANARAELRQTQAEDLLGFLLVDLRQKLEPVGRLALLDDVGDQAMAYFAAVPEEALSDQELARYATALHQIGDVRRRQGKLPAARQPFERSLALARELAARHPEHGERLFELGQSHFWVGFVRWKDGDLDGAREHFDAYLDLSRRLVAIDAENATWQRELAYAYSNLGTVERDGGDLAAAGGHYRRSLAIRQRLAARAPEDLERRLDLARAHNALGVLLETAADPRAREHFEAELALKAALVEAAPERLPWRDDLGVSHNYLGRWLLPRGQWPAAREHLETAVGLYRELVAGDPANADWRYKLALNRGALGRALLALGETEDALDHLHRFHRLLSELVGQDPARRDWRRELATAHLYLGTALARDGERPAGRRHLERALAILGPLSAEDVADRDARSRLAESYARLATLEQEAGEPAAARRAWQRAAAAAGPLAAEAGDWRLLAPWTLALVHLGRDAEARPALERLQAMGFCEPFYRELCTRSAAGEPASPGR